jgi:hypothetical protein
VSTLGTLPVPGGAWNSDRAVPGTAYPPRGVFGENPGATPKYATNKGAIYKDFRDTMARMFIQVGAAEYNKFIASVAQLDPNAQALARVLAGTNVALGGKNNATGTGYIDFILQNVQHQFQEKMQVVETLSDSYVVYFFGQGAPTFQYSGMLINTKQDDQANNMLRIYEYMIRGYQLARRKKLLRLRYNDLIVAGAAYNFGFGLAGENEMACPFNFSFLVKSITPLQDPYAGIVMPETLFATQSVLAAAGFPNGTLPGQVISVSGNQQQVAVMAPETPTATDPLEAMKQQAPPPLQIFDPYSPLVQSDPVTAYNANITTAVELTQQQNTIDIMNQKTPSEQLAINSARTPLHGH